MPTKFTPERITQIRTLIEQGKSRKQIAEAMGVPLGSLAVTCSKLGISLRQPNGATTIGANGSASITICLRYKEHERTSQLPLTHDLIGQLAVEAVWRNVNITELIAQIVKAVLDKHLLPDLLREERPCQDGVPVTHPQPA